MARRSTALVAARLRSTAGRGSGAALGRCAAARSSRAALLRANVRRGTANGGRRGAAGRLRAASFRSTAARRAAFRRSGAARRAAVIMAAMTFLAEAVEQTSFSGHRSATENQGGDPARPLHSTRLLKRVQTREGSPAGRPVLAVGMARRTTRGLSAPLFRSSRPPDREPGEPNPRHFEHPAPDVPVVPDVRTRGIDGDVTSAVRVEIDALRCMTAIGQIGAIVCCARQKIDGNTGRSGYAARRRDRSASASAKARSQRSSNSIPMRAAAVGTAL